MDREALKEILPHREPMLLLDEAELVDGEAHGKLTITGDEFFVQGHFPGNPIVPGVILCEILAQSVCVLLQNGMPAGATAAIFAARYNSDAPFAARCVVLSTLFSMLTIPLWCWVVG